MKISVALLVPILLVPGKFAALHASFVSDTASIKRWSSMFSLLRATASD
jgi:hypothetical protein